MKAIVAVDENWAIGCRGQLLFRISADLKRFKELTLGRPVILGRKTLSTFLHMNSLWFCGFSLYKVALRNVQHTALSS